MLHLSYTLNDIFKLINRKGIKIHKKQKIIKILIHTYFNWKLTCEMIYKTKINVCSYYKILTIN